MVTNGIAGLFSEEIANKYVPVSEYQRNSADYVRAGVAFAAPAACHCPTGYSLCSTWSRYLTTGQTAFVVMFLEA